MNSVYLLLFVGLPVALIFARWIDRRSERRNMHEFAAQLKLVDPLLKELDKKRFSKKKEFDEALDEYNKQYRPSTDTGDDDPPPRAS